MTLIKYKPIRFPKVMAAIYFLIAVTLISSVVTLISMINDMVTFPYRDVEHDRIYFVNEDEMIKSDVYRKDVVAFNSEIKLDVDYIKMLVKTPENKLVYITGDSDHMGDYYALELMMENHTYDDYSFSGRAEKMDSNVENEMLSLVTGDMLSENGVTVDDISDIYIRMDCYCTPPDGDDIKNAVLRCVFILLLLLIALWPVVRNGIYHSRVKKGIMQTDPRELEYKGLAPIKPAQLYHTEKDDFWLIDNTESNS